MLESLDRPRKPGNLSSLDPCARHKIIRGEEILAKRRKDEKKAEGRWRMINIAARLARGKSEKSRFFRGIQGKVGNFANESQNRNKVECV